VTRDEWDTLAFLIENGWKGGLADDQADAYFAFLADYDRLDVERALKRLVRTGQPFVPAAAEIVAAIEPETPGWGEAWPVIRRALWAHHDDEQRGLEMVAKHLGVPAAGWCRSYGWRRLQSEQTEDPEFGGAVRHRLAESFTDGMASPASRDRLTELASAESKGLHRFDPAGLIGR